MMPFGIEQRVFAPVQRSYEMIADLARQTIHNAGRGGALDGLVQSYRDDKLEQIDYDLDNLIVRPRTPHDEAAIAEVEVLKRYVEVHGPQTAGQMEAMSETAEPDPLALKQLIHWLDEKLPNPDPDPMPGAGKQANL